MQTVFCGVNKKHSAAEVWRNKQENGGNMKKEKKKISIAVKLIGMSVLPVVILGIILTIYGQSNLKKSLKNEIYEGLKSAALAVQGAYDAAGSGDFIMLESGNVIKGTFVVSGNYNLADQLSSKSGIDVSLYYGNSIVVTSLMDGNNSRMTEGTVSSEVEATVLDQGKKYFSEDVQLGTEHYYGYYMPVVNEEGRTYGMIFTGKKSAQVNAAITSDALKMSLLSAAVIAAALLLTAVMAVSIARALKQMMDTFGKVADGNLSEMQEEKGSSRRDEIGAMLHGIAKLRTFLRNMIGSIQHSIGVLTQSADELEQSAALTSSESDKVDQAISEISGGAASQAEETEAAMTDIENMGRIISEMAGDISAMTQITGKMGTAGEDADRILGELSDYTKKTTGAVEVIAQQIQATNDSAQQIQKAVEMITSIADETNLLSLNASIEAARAGEQGRGFAIVATQIQKLAEQSSTSAQQIERIIHVLLNDAQTTVQTMDQVVEIVGNQEQKLGQTGACFETVSRGIQDSLDKMKHIEEQSKVLDESRGQIMQMITSLSAISEENAAASEETASSTAQLNERVKQITKEAAVLKELAVDLEKQIGIFHLGA